MLKLYRNSGGYYIIADIDRRISLHLYERCSSDMHKGIFNEDYVKGLEFVEEDIDINRVLSALVPQLDKYFTVEGVFPPES